MCEMLEAYRVQGQLPGILGGPGCLENQDAKQAEEATVGPKRNSILEAWG